MNEFGAWIFGILAAVVPGIGGDENRQFYGYMEADYVYVAPASPGRLTSIEVGEGEQVEEGMLLFRLEDSQLQAMLRAAEARQAVALANWQNLETGSRSQEVDVVRATLEKAKADQALAKVTLERTVRLMEQGLVPAAKLDTDRANLASADAQVAQLMAQLEVAELPARDAQIVAAEATLTAAKADVDAVLSSLAERAVVAPVSGRIEQIYFRSGEVAGAGTPVLSILAPTDMKARFFIPEAERMGFSIGDELTLTCDGCAADLRARLTYMSSDPQHTPPIIYSREERSRLVFMAEAQLEGGNRLLPGQPVTLMRVLEQADQ